MGFGEILTEFKTALEADADLKTFVSASWGKPLSVKIVWRDREEIAPQDLPLIMLTRPTSTRTFHVSGQFTDNPAVRIYAGFYQTDADQRQLQIIEFEEKILQALQEHPTLYRYIDLDAPVQSANDEGSLGDICFSVIQLVAEQEGISEL